MSNFARWFIDVQGRESHILGKIAPQEAQSRTNRPAKVQGVTTYCKRHATDALFVEYGAACGLRSACVDIGQSSLARYMSTDSYT